MMKEKNEKDKKIKRMGHREYTETPTFKHLILLKRN